MQIVGVVLTILFIPALLRFSTLLISLGDTSAPSIVATFLFLVLIGVSLGIWWGGTVIKPRNQK